MPVKLLMNPFSFFKVITSLLIFNCSLLIPQEKASVESTLNYERVLKYLTNMKYESRIAELNNEITFTRDVGTFNLLEGHIYTCSLFEDKMYGLYFVGEGTFQIHPPTKIERDQLFRFYEEDEFPVEFSSLFMLFADSTYHEFSRQLEFKNKDSEMFVNNEISNCLEFLTESDDGYSRSDFLRSILDGEDNGFFYAHLESSFDDFFFQIDPYEDEEVSFMRSYKTALISKARKEPICQFPAMSDTYLLKRDKHFLDIISYRIESTIDDDFDFYAKCTIDFISSEKKERWVTLYLYSELAIDSIIWEEGEVTDFYREEEDDEYEEGEFWLHIKEKYLDGAQHHFTVYYKGDLLEKNEYGWISLKSPSSWYPWYDYRAKAYFGLIFHTPADYDFISVGNLTQKQINDEVMTTTWICNEPIVNASFNIGKFEKTFIQEDDIPEVSVYMSEYGHNQIGHQLAKYGVLSLSDASEWIASDVSNSIRLFENLFGDIPYTEIKITEVPYFHGLAFPGLIHLSWITYQTSEFEGAEEIFRAHEIAHQWWGIGVDYKSYHDQWLSEGFSEYSGLWYLQVIKNDNDLFFETLERWGDEILNNRKSIFGSGQEGGPIWLGYRTQSTDTEGDYWLLIYKKGAFILHMLRGMLLDLKTMNEDLFLNMMKDYYKTYRGKAASTEDFKNIVSKHFGEDMSWFFNQFVYGTDLPLYRFSYNTRKTSEGKFLVTCKVIQEQVPEDFKMYIPLKIVFPNEQVARLRIEMSGREKVFELPLMPLEPEEIIFNDLYSVLCEVDYESWK